MRVWWQRRLCRAHMGTDGTPGRGMWIAAGRNQKIDITEGLLPRALVKLVVGRLAQQPYAEVEYHQTEVSSFRS